MRLDRLERWKRQAFKLVIWEQRREFVQTYFTIYSVEGFNKVSADSMHFLPCIKTVRFKVAKIEQVGGSGPTFNKVALHF